MATFYRADGWVKSTLGPAVSGAQIYVCTQPANTVWPIDSVTRKPIPNWQPTPQAAIYADVNGLQAIQQPLFTDGFGHYNFYVLTGSYTVVVINNGAVQQVYTDQSLGLFGLVIPPSGNVSGSNLVPNTIILGNGGSNIKSGPLLTGDTTKFLDGSGVFSTPPGLPGITVSSTPPTAGDVLTATSSTTADWEPASGGTTYVSRKLVGNDGSFSFDLTPTSPNGGLYLIVGSTVITAWDGVKATTTLKITQSWTDPSGIEPASGPELIFDFTNFFNPPEPSDVPIPGSFTEYPITPVILAPGASVHFEGMQTGSVTIDFYVALIPVAVN